MIIILKLNNLTIIDKKGRILIRDFSFVLNKGDKIALIGEEGNGKSTLIKLIYDPVLVQDYVSYTGTVVTDDTIIGYLPQSLDERWLHHEAITYLLSADPDTEIAPEAYNRLKLFYELGAAIGLDPALIDDERPLATLSGGEKIKLELLKLLAAKPDLWLLDEPTNDLDLATLKWLEDFLNDLEAPLLFVSHDEVLLNLVANGIIHLEQLKKKSEPQVTFSRIRYPEYQQRRMDMLKRQTAIANKQAADHQAKLERWRRVYQQVEYAQDAVSRQDPHQAKMLKRKMHAVKAMKHRIDDEEVTHAPDPEEAIDIYFGAVELAANRTVLDIHWPLLTAGDRVLSRNIDLLVKGPRKVVIIGRNGIGKTTLLKRIYAELGTASLKVAYVPQDYAETMDEGITPLAYLTVSGDKEEMTKIRNFLGSLKFTSAEMEHPIGSLSGGQKVKLALLRLVLQGPQVILLDEPTRNLSPLSNPVIRNMLRQYQGCLIAISHDRMFIRELADELYELDENGLRRLYNPED